MTNLRLTGDFPLLNSTDPLELEARAASAGLPRFATEGALPAGPAAGQPAGRPGPPAAGRVPGLGDLKFLDLAAGDVVAQGVLIRDPSVSLVAGPWPKVHAEIHARPLDAPLTVRADLDFSAQTAGFRRRASSPPPSLTSSARGCTATCASL